MNKSIGYDSDESVINKKEVNMWKRTCFSPRQEKILFELLDAVIGDVDTADKIEWATDTEKKQLEVVRSELKRCLTE